MKRLSICLMLLAIGCGKEKATQQAKGTTGSKLGSAVTTETVRGPSAGSGSAEDILRDKLKQLVDLQFSETPVNDVIEFLENSWGLQISLDRQVLEKNGVPIDKPVSIQVKQISLGSALSLLAIQLEAACVIKDGVVQITAPGESAAESSLTDSIILQRAEQKIRQKLKAHVELEFIETPFGDIVDFLRAYSTLNIVLDRPALEKVYITSDAPFTIKVENVSLEGALGLLLDQRNATLTVTNEVVLITTQAKASEKRPR